MNRYSVVIILSVLAGLVIASAIFIYRYKSTSDKITIIPAKPTPSSIAAITATAPKISPTISMPESSPEAKLLSICDGVWEEKYEKADQRVLECLDVYRNGKIEKIIEIMGNENIGSSTLHGSNDNSEKSKQKTKDTVPPIYDILLTDDYIDWADAANHRLPVVGGFNKEIVVYSNNFDKGSVSYLLGSGDIDKVYSALTKYFSEIQQLGKDIDAV